MSRQSLDGKYDPQGDDFILRPYEEKSSARTADMAADQALMDEQIINDPLNANANFGENTTLDERVAFFSDPEIARFVPRRHKRRGPSLRIPLQVQFHLHVGSETALPAKRVVDHRHIRPPSSTHLADEGVTKNPEPGFVGEGDRVDGIGANPSLVAAEQPLERRVGLGAADRGNSRGLGTAGRPDGHRVQPERQPCQ